MKSSKDTTKNKKYTSKERKRRYGISTSLKQLLEEENLNLKVGIYGSRIENSLKGKKSIKSLGEKFLLSNLLMESEKQELIKLYGDDDKVKYQILPLINFNKISDCTIMKYGARKSAVDIEYSYCKTCDYNSLKPICLSCITKCHYGHVVKFIFKKGHIKCSCGEKNHMIMKINYKKILNMNCLCNEWNSTANLRYYYINKLKEPICILCDYCCQYEKNKNNRIKLKKKKEIPQCSCKNKDIHTDKRTICEKLLNLISSNNDYNFLLHPIQFVNMIFKSNNNFKYIFEYFDFFVNDLNNSRDNTHIIHLLSKMRRIDIEFTNIYKTLIIFEKIIEKSGKNNNLYFYHQEASKYFCFNLVKKLLEILMVSSIEEKLFYQLTNKFLYLFHKVYINEKTKLLNKFKLIDLKHLNFFSRIVVFKENKKIFKESQSIISFLIDFLIYINNKRPSIIEAIHCIKEIISIFRKFSCYNLITNNDMVKICSNILENFIWIRNIKNNIFKNDQKDIKSKIDSYYFNNISIKAFYIIIKTIQNFIYNYNDNIIDLIINNKKKYPNINDIKSDNVSFIFKKNELGELIYKLAIYILSTLERSYKKINNKRILLIKRLSIEIIKYALNEDDNYMLNIEDSIYKYDIICAFENNKYYEEYLQQTNIISNAYNQYFNFEKSLDEILNVINNSLNIILEKDTIKNIDLFNGDKIIHEFNSEQKLAVFYTNFFPLIIKIISIVHNHQKRKRECEKKDKKEKNDNLNELIVNISSSLEDEIFKKILCFSFSFMNKSSDCSFLILSHYIFKGLVKLPEKYCQMLFKLFHLCFKNIFESENNTIKIDSSFLIKRLYNYLDELMDNRDLKKNNINLIFCIGEFLHILEIATFNCEYSLFNDFIYKIQYLIMMIGKKYKIVQKYFELENKGESSNNNNELNIIKKTFSTYLKLINNCFDISMEEDRKKIKEMIDINDIINTLENYNVDIDLKTEFLRFIRKNMIDLKYSFKENNEYRKAIINNKDNLEEIKDNSLISNSNYPTKFLSFLKDLYNITTICSIKEQLEEKKNEKVKSKITKKNSNIRNWVIEKRGTRDINLSHEISDLGETKFDHSGFFEEYKNIASNNITSNLYDNETIYYHNKNNHYFEGDNKKIPILRANNISKLMSNTDIYPQRMNKLNMMQKERKRKRDMYIINDDNIIERDIDNKDLILLKEIIKENDNKKLYNKIKELNLFEDAFNRRFYYIINNELDDILQKDWKLNNIKVINSFRNYIENGILIPIIYYFKKIMIMVDSFTGYEMIQLFSLLEKCLKLKIYLYENHYIWNNEIKPNKFILFEHYNIFNCYYKNRDISIIDHEKFQKNENFHLTKEYLDIIKSKKISLYDFSILYQILEKELFCLIKEKKPFIFHYKNNRDIYKEESTINIIINNFENFMKKNKKDFVFLDTQKRLLRALIIYKHSKMIHNNENNSSILSVLSEINLEYEINFRNLLLSSIIQNGKDVNSKNEFVSISYYLLFKLLYFQTEETQSEIINIINKTENNNSDFLKVLSDILYNKIILSIIEYLNPPDKLIYSNYLISCYLLWIFKFLIEKDNKHFKLILISSISYKYISSTFYFFKNNQIIQNNLILEKSIYESSVYGEGNNIYEEKEKDILFYNNENENKNKNDMIKIIKFYDFLLLLITKICTISNWEKIQKLPQDNFLFDLFSSIMDLLEEIIHENKSEVLSLLFDDIIVTKGGRNFERVKKIESFQDFVKNISNILLDKKNNEELNTQVKKRLIDYINGIIEEKECDETIQKCIEKYLNINKLYKNISHIMKIYFLKNIKPKNIENESKIKENKNNSDLIKKNNSKDFSQLEKHLTYNIKGDYLNKRNNGINNYKDYEENSTSKNKMLSLIVDINSDIKKNLFAIKRKEDKEIKEPIFEELNNNKNNSFDSEMKISELTFGKILYEYFIKEFFDNSQFIENLDFKLCNSFYKYIKYIKLKKEDSDQYEIENIIRTYYKEEDINFNRENNYEDLYYSNYNEHISQSEKDYIEKYFIEKFFEGIISKIEIINQKKKNKIILFTKYPFIRYITGQTKFEFKENANRDSEFSKKYDLIKYIDYFIEEINYNKRNKKKFIFLTKINFHYLPKFSYYLAIFHNLFFLFTMKGDNQISITNTLMNRIKDKDKIKNMINKSANDWNNLYQIFCIVYMIINASLIFMWMMIHLPLYYKINKVDYLKMRKKKNRKMSIFDKLYITILILNLKGEHILPLIYEFFVSLICILLKQRNILYPFLLIPILYINKTMRNILLSIQLNFYPFILTFFFAFIIMYLLANIYFFFFNLDFQREINYYSDNYCKTLTFAFLNALDNGLRARGGMGDSAIRVSYNKDKKHYILRLILDDIFFFLIVIIMIDLVFGIVLRSFDKLQHMNYKYDLDKKNHCFICDSKKENLEKNRINFYEHVHVTHNTWNYIEYMIKIKLNEEINPINEYILNKINKKDISWLPTYKDLENENINDNNYYEDKNVIILNENFPNYKIKPIPYKNI